MFRNVNFVRVLKLILLNQSWGQFLTFDFRFTRNHLLVVVWIFFGPLYVTHGRGKIKRYGCLSIDLTCRAIHVDLVPDLTSSSVINAIRRKWQSMVELSAFAPLMAQISMRHIENCWKLLTSWMLTGLKSL